MIAEANRAYFLALAHTRGASRNYRKLAFLVVFLLGLNTFVGLNALIFWEGARSYLWLFNAHLVILGLSACFLVLSPFKRLLHRFQPFFSWIMASLALVLVYSICMLTLMLTSLDGVGGQGLDPMVFGLVGSAGVVLLVSATVVHVLLLRQRLRIGHSEKRTVANYLAVSGANRSKTFWIILGLVAVVPNVLTQGQYLVNVFGAVGLIFVASVTPSLPVEFAYLAYLKSRDRGYWERLPRLTGKQRQLLKKERLRVAKKAVMWALIVVAGIALLWVLNAVLPPGWPGR